MEKLTHLFKKVDQQLNGRVSVILDFMRGISAILVVMEHLSSRLFIGFGYLDHPSIFVKILYLINLLGGPAVIIFFVLSGLFISRTVFKAIFNHNWTWKQYLINRFSRIYIVLVPALVLTYICDKVALNYGNFQHHTTIIGLLESLPLVWRLGDYGTNYPMWSLEYEFWYYMLFPLLCLVIKYKTLPLRVASLILSLLIFYMVGSKVTLYFNIWLIGSVILLIPGSRLFRGRLGVVSSLSFLCIMIPVRPLVETGKVVCHGRESNYVYS